LATVAERVAHSVRHAELVRFSLECKSKIDRSDAFVMISTVDEEVPDDVVGHLADMYLNWARLKGFETKIVHEDLFAPKQTKEIMLLIEGVAIFGMLKSEAGMHELVYGRTPGKAKKSAFVKVRVLPVVDQGDSEIPAAEVSLEKRNSARSDLSPDEAAPLIEDLLHSELAWRKSLGSVPTRSDQEAEAQVENILRKYTLRPKPTARDARTGVTTNHLNELWKGALDEFLYAALRLDEN